MTRQDAEIVLAFAECDMNANEVDRRKFMHRNTVIYHLDKTKRETGLDAQHFYDLLKLLEVLEDE